MVTHFIMCTYEAKHGFRFVEGIWLNRKSRQIRFSFSEMTYFTSSVRNLFYVTIISTVVPTYWHVGDSRIHSETNRGHEAAIQKQKH